MPYIIREDGEHFVIPSYRDVITTKQKSFLKKEILLLSQSYGEYITLQKKDGTKYEVTFSPDKGYLLGESIWHHFKRPQDMIYCEAVPNTTEAILVIVKGGSVYLDGSFPIDSIPEELVVFLTQQNNFEIYIYGDVPISQMPEVGKFSFETAAVKSFTVLDEPVFPTLPLLKIYQLQLVTVTLQEHGIGVFPIKPVIVAVVGAGLFWMIYSYMSSQPAVVEAPIQQVNPYLGYENSLISPAPDQELKDVLKVITSLYTLPQWTPSDFKYQGGSLSAKMTANGGRIEDLLTWAKRNGISAAFDKAGLGIVVKIPTTKRSSPKQIYDINQILSMVLDKIHDVYSGNNVIPGDIKSSGVYKTADIDVKLVSVSPMLLNMIIDQFKDLPLILVSFDMKYENSAINGVIKLQALGS